MLACIITAGGMGRRFDTIIPKQYHKINGEFILQKTINAFKQLVDKIVVVIRKDDEIFFLQNFNGVEYVFGGDNRQSSVLRGLEYLVKYSPEFVLITDGARPFTSTAIIQNVVRELQKGETGVIPCIQMQDTIKKIKNGYIVDTLDREKLVAAQTPQGFKFDVIYNLHKKYKALVATDDAYLLEQEDIKVKVIMGEKLNIKITTPEDVANLIFI